MANHILAARAPRALDLSAVQNFPAATPPPGVIPNFKNPESRGSVFVVSSAFLVGFMVFFFAVRAYAKICIIKRLHWDDRQFELIYKADESYSEADISY
jgi:hypothetical protein